MTAIAMPARQPAWRRLLGFNLITGIIGVGGALIAANGLTLQRGGFLERTVADMLKLIEEERAA